MPEIKINDLVVKYGKKNPIIAIDHLSCEFSTNKVNVIIGPSGCGKSSLLRAITGLENYEGDIFFDQLDARFISTKDRNIGYVTQKIGLYPFANLFNNIANPLLNTLASGDEIRERVNEVASLLKLNDCLYRKPSKVSIGQAQRAAIARAIVKKPTFYVFDEAFSNLDVQTADELTFELKQIFKKYNATVIFVTHDIKEALTLGERIIVMNEGKVVEITDAEKILKSKNPVTKELIKEYEKQ